MTSPQSQKLCLAQRLCDVFASLLGLTILLPLLAVVAITVRLLHDPERCQVMGNAGHALAEHVFDLRQVVATHLRIYQELIGKS